MFLPSQPDQEDSRHNLGKCPNAVQSRRLRRFRKCGLWDDAEALRSAQENKVKFTPHVRQAIYSEETLKLLRLVKHAANRDHLLREL